MSGLFLGVYAVLDSPREISRWQMAAANEFWTEAQMAALRGDTVQAKENRDKAFAKLEKALEWSPNDRNWLFVRARWNTQVGKQKAALADMNQVISQTGETSFLLGLRMETLQQLGRHEEAVKDANQIDAISQASGDPSRGDALNTVAYVKAVGQIDLPGALRQSDQAVRSALEEIEQNKKFDAAEPGFLVWLLHTFFGNEFGNEYRRQRDYQAKHIFVMRLDTRGFVHYQMGNYRKALSDLDVAADGIEGLLRESEWEFKKKQRAIPDARVLEIALKSIDKEAAVILYHRVLAHEKLGHSAAAAQDRKRVFELTGREGDETLF